MKTILIPIFDGRVSSRLDCTESFQAIKIKKEKVHSIEQVKIFSSNPIEKLNQILFLKPDIIICNGLTDLFQNELSKNNIDVIPWIYGEVDEVIENYMKGVLAVQSNEVFI